MKIILCLSLFLASLVLHAKEPEPLRIAISSFASPYIMQGSNQQFYGFDISMITFVCKSLQRPCIYQPMTLKQIYPAIINKQADLGVSTIVITVDKMHDVEISMPYMLSTGQFISQNALAQQPFSYQLLDNKRIGVVDTNSFKRYLRTLTIQNPEVIAFDTHDEVINALRTGRIDVGFLDSHIVQYWQHNSSGQLHALGQPFSVGNGLGIIAELGNKQLIEEINYALTQYQLSGQFKQDYQLYLESF